MPLGRVFVCLFSSAEMSILTSFVITVFLSVGSYPTGSPVSWVLSIGANVISVATANVGIDKEETINVLRNVFLNFSLVLSNIMCFLLLCYIEIEKNILLV